MGKSFYEQRLEKSKKKAQKEESVETLLEKLTPALPEAAAPTIEVFSEAQMKEYVKDTTQHTAFNTFYDTSRKQFMLVTVQYNPTTKESSVKSIEPFSDNIVVASRKIAEMLTMKLFKKEEEI